MTKQLLNFGAGTKPSEICSRFRKVLNSELRKLGVPKAPVFEIPMLGEVYWLDSKLGDKNTKNSRSWKLVKHGGAGKDQILIQVNSPARKTTNVRLRVKCSSKQFNEALSIQAQKALGAKVCDDITNFGTECMLTLESASFAAKACAKMISTGEIAA